MGLPWPSDPHLRRWMLFVDGENLTRRVEEMGASGRLKLVAGAFYQPGDFVWLPGKSATEALTNKGNVPITVQPHAIRSHYYTSVVGDEPKRGQTREALWSLGFHPEVFRREKSTGRSKGVDIALARDLLANAFRNNLDVAVLVAGDGDYVPLVEETKRLGKVVYVVFPRSSGLSNDLRLSCDMFFDWDENLASLWPLPTDA